jgi:type II secretion system protein D
MLSVERSRPAPKGGKKAAPAPAAPASVRVAALPSANALVVQAPEDKLALARDLIASFDLPTAGDSTIHIIRLKHARAESLAEKLTNMVPAPPRGRPRTVFIQADAFTNSVIIRASEADRKMLEDMVASLDEMGEELRETQIIPLKHASAAAMVPVLEQLYKRSSGQTRTVRGRRVPSGGGEEDVIIAAAPGDRAIVVDAPRDKVKEIEQLVASLDEGKPGQLQVRTYQMTGSNARDIASALSNLFRKETSRGRRGAPATTGEPDPRFEADVTTNQLMVAATEAQFAEIEPVIRKFEGAGGAATQTQTFFLEHAKAADIVGMLREVVEESDAGRLPWWARRGQQDKVKVRIAAIEAANAVVVKGPPGKLVLAKQLIDEFDRPTAVKKKAVIKIVHLDKAEAQTLADSINQMLSGQRGRRRGRGQEDEEQVTVTAEPNSNSVLVRGPEEDVGEVLAMIAKLDEKGTASAVEMRVYAVKHSDATELSRTVGRLFQDIIRQTRRGRGRGAAVPFGIVANERTNSLLVSTTAAHFALFEEVLARLDKEDPRPIRDAKYIYLSSADAYDVADALGRMFSDRRGAERPVIEADLYANAITVIAKDTDLKQIEQLVAQLDKRDTSLTVRVVPLSKIRAGNLADLLKSVYGHTSGVEVIVTDKLPARKGDAGLFAPMPAVDDSSPAPGGAESEAKPKPPTTRPAEEGAFQPPARPPVTIAVDKATNSLVISATRQDMDNIQSLIDQFVLSGVSAEAELKIYILEKADPESVARTLDALFNPKQTAAVARQQTQQRGRRTQTPQVRAQPPAISVVADARTRSLFVRAKPLDFELITPLVKHLDQVAVSVSEVRVFALKNTDAEQTAQNLRELFRLASSPAPAARTSRRGRTTPQQQRVEMVRRMMQMRVKEGVARVDAATEVSISANRNTNTVIVAAPEDAMRLIAQLIEELDQTAAASNLPVVKLYPLRNAEVSPTVTALQAIFTGQQAQRTARGRSRTPAAQQAPVIITGDEAGKVVLVSAPLEKHRLIASVIDELDSRPGVSEAAVKIYKLRHAEAERVARGLSEAMVAGAGGGRRGRGRTATAGAPALRISADRSSNSLIVRASKDEHEKIAELVAQMDVAPTAATALHVIPLNNADPAALAQVVTSLYGTGRRGRRTPGQQEVVIQADTAARMLVVRADEETFASIRQLVSQLDEKAVGEATRTVIALEHAEAAPVSAALSQAFAPARGARGRRRTQTPEAGEDVVSVVAEPVSNSLIVTATTAGLEQVRGLLAKLDTDAGGSRTELLLLEHAKAADLAKVLSTVAGSTGGRGRRGAVGQENVVVSADVASNALVMSGPAGELAKMIKMARDLDQATTTALPGVYILPLTKGEAATVAAMVRDLYRQQVSEARRTRQTVEALAVTADDRANALVIAASKDMYDQVARWVGQVEQMTPRRGKLKIITLQYADPEEVERAIQGLFGGSSGVRPVRGGSGGRTRTRSTRGARGPVGAAGNVETSVLTGQRAILVDASDEDYAEIAKLVAALEEAAAKARRQVRVFVLQRATNARVAAALNQMYRAAARRGREEDVVSVTALAQTNAVVVAATKEKLEEVAHLVEVLDTEQIAPKLEYRIYPLAHAMPSKVLPMLRQMLRQVQRTRPGEPIDVQADERTRSIIITARGTVFDQVEKIINTLDKPPAHVKAEVLIVPLKKADAASLAAVLNEMLRPAAGGQATAEARALQEQVRRLRIRSTVKQDIPELDLTQPIKIAADPARPQGSNALVITSTPDNLKALQAVVEVLDTVPVIEGVKVSLVHLRNADAQSVMQILREIFNQGQKLAGRAGTSVAGRAEPESTSGKALTNVLNVSADIRTNTLVMSGKAESLKLAELVATDLDRASGKVVTEVRLFRLKHADASRLVPVLRAVFAEGGAAPAAEGLRTQVTRLRTILAKAEGHESKRAKARPALTIQADAGTNIIVVAARADVMPLIADVIRTMDIPGAGALNTVRIYPLTNADATRMSAVVQGLYSGPNANLIRAEDRPTVVVDTRTNALVISASDKTFAMLSMLLEKLDAETPVELHNIRLVRLENAEAASLVTALQRMMDARVQRQSALGAKDAEAMRAVIVADARSNSLIVAGSDESFKLVEGLAKQLDGASPALGGQVQLFPLAHGNSGTLAATLSNLFNLRYQAARTADVSRQKPIILADLRTNSLLVAANADDTAVLKSLLAKLDVELLDPAVKLVVRPLKHNDAGTVGPMIRTIFQARLSSMTPAGQTPAPQDRVDVATDALSNALVISASKENLALIDELLGKVDIEPPAETGIVKMFYLKNNDAQRVATMLQGLVSQGLYKPGLTAARGNAALAAREKVAIAVDLRTNVLIVSASKENTAVVSEIIAALEKADAYGLLGAIKLYPLARADATRLAQTLQQLFAAKRAAEVAAGTGARSLQVSVIPDPRTNTLLVVGGRESFTAIESMLKRLDGEETLAANVFRVFYLKQATATTLQPMMQNLFDRRPTRGLQREPITLIADPKINALIVGATPEDIELAESLINRLDVKPETPGTTVKVFPLSKADATRVSQTLDSLNQARGAGAAAPVGVSVDERINALVVQGGAADLERIEELVKQLDTDIVARVTEIRVFPLSNADATELARILLDTLTNKPKALTAASPNRQTLLQFVARSEDGEELVTRALQQGVLVTADARTNSLVVAAPAENMPLLKRLIEALDAINPRSAQIRVFTLKNADARQMAELLRQLFRLQAGAGAAGGARKVKYTLVTTRPSAESPSATLGSDEQYALTVTVDVRTNSLLIGGTRQYVELAAKVIEELDASTAQDRKTEVYRLRNAKAADIETALRGFLDQERQKLMQTLGAQGVGAGAVLLEREVAIVAEEASNTLLISASPRYFEEIRAMISQLDQPPPQVLIQVLLAEVTLDDTTELGIDWNFTKVFGSTHVAGGTDFGVSAAIAAFGGLNLSITGGDVNFFLRALQSQGRLEVLSRPQILAADNQAALINVGQSVPIITNTRITEEGTTLNTIQYRPVGIILNVTPRITPDGFVQLDVQPEISSLSESSVQISDTVNAVIINERKAQTTVLVQDGHTIIIGGLITTRDSDREDKVPLLGDLPLLGALFKTTKKVRERTELLIVLTPQILRNVADSDRTTARQARRLSLLRQARTDPARQAALRTLNDMLLNGRPDAEDAKDERTTVIPLEVLPDLPQPDASDAGGSPKEGP